MLHRFCWFFFIGLFFVSLTFGEIGWCGNVWPNNNSEILVGNDVNVYFQVWKDSVTDASPTEAGEGISAALNYRIAGETGWTEMEMSYNTDVGNNDEFICTIPGMEVIGGISFEVYCEAFDAGDTSTCQGADQEGNPATQDSPLVYIAINPTEIDVTVHFSVNMNGTVVSEPVSVAGTFNDWDPVTTTLSDDDTNGIYEGAHLIPAGSARSQEYKYVNSGEWEISPNRLFEVDDTSPDQELPMDYWNEGTTHPVWVIFRVDMSAEVLVDPYIGGSAAPLHWGWDDGWTEDDRVFDDGTHMDETTNDNIFTTIIEFASGSYRYVEYKYTTDGTDNEPLPAFVNHSFTLDEEADTMWLPIDVFGVIDFIKSDISRPGKAKLMQNYPNPFNSSTAIEFTIPNDAHTKLCVYNLEGKLVQTLIDRTICAGHYRLFWEGTDSEGNPVPSGTYIYELDISDFSISRTMTLAK